MATGYTRQSTAQIVNGQTANASDFNNEYNAIQAAFNASSGHTHDGTAGGGAPISLSGVTGLLGVGQGGTGQSVAGAPAANAIGALAIASNLSDLASASTARTNLGLGTSAVQNVAFFAQTANNLSDLASASTARTNLGLGTSATVNTGTSGATVPLANGNNTWAGTNTFTGSNNTFNNISYILGGGVVLGSASPPEYASLSLGTPYMQVAPSGAGGAGILINAYANIPWFVLRRADGTPSSPSAIQATELIGALGWAGYGATAFGTATAAIKALATENWSDTARGSRFIFTVTKSAGVATVDVMSHENDGGVLVDPDHVTGGSKGLGTINVSGGFYVNGTSIGGGSLTLSGDVTGTGVGSITTTVANNAVTNAKAAQMTTNTIKGNNTGGTANASDLSVTQVTAMLNTFTSSLQGLVPSSGGGTTNYLRADGSWTTIPGTISAAGPIGSATAVPVITYNAQGQLTTVTTAALGTAAALNVGTGNNNIVQLNGSAQIPAVDGSLLINILPSGIMLPYAALSAPSGWLLCYGQAISRTTYSALYSAIGVTFGTGDGSTTFNLPDMRGRVAAGADNMGGTAANRLGSGSTGGVTGSATLGASGGEQAHTQTTTEMPSHNHNLPTHDGSGATSGGMPLGYNSGGSGSANFTGMATNGSGSAMNVTQPTLVMTYIIKT